MGDSVKVNIGKLTLPNRFEDFLPEQLTLNDIEILPMRMVHLRMYSTLPLHHRLLIAQAITEKVADVMFDNYSVNRIW